MPLPSRPAPNAYDNNNSLNTFMFTLYWSIQHVMVLHLCTYKSVLTLLLTSKCACSKQLKVSRFLAVKIVWQLNTELFLWVTVYIGYWCIINAIWPQGFLVTVEAENCYFHTLPVLPSSDCQSLWFSLMLCALHIFVVIVEDAEGLDLLPKRILSSDVKAKINELVCHSWWCLYLFYS